MLRFRYSKDEADISGSPQDLLQLREQLLGFLRSGAGILRLKLNYAFDPTPYSNVIAILEFLKTTSRTKISLRSGTEMVVEGSPKNLEGFSSWLDVPVDANLGYHNHYDYIGQDDYVDKESLPMVIGVL